MVDRKKAKQPVRAALPAIKNFVSLAEHKRVADSQRSYARELADQIEAGILTSDVLGRHFVGAILRGWADALPDLPKKVRGAPRKIDPGQTALMYAIHHVGRGMSKAAAIARIAEDHDVDVGTVKAVLSNGVGDSAIEWMRLIPKKGQ